MHRSELNGKSLEFQNSVMLESPEGEEPLINWGRKACLTAALRFPTHPESVIARASLCDTGSLILLPEQLLRCPEDRTLEGGAVHLTPSPEPESRTRLEGRHPALGVFTDHVFIV
ncbi:UNVERIFIED_CONTAM: hypothetical protein FKN15_031550 [Acipenser sinensis]